MYNAHEIRALEYANAFILWHAANLSGWAIRHQWRFGAVEKAAKCQALIDAICRDRPDMQRHLLKIKLSMDPTTIGKKFPDLSWASLLEDYWSIRPRGQSMGRGLRKTTPILLPPFGT